MMHPIVTTRRTCAAACAVLLVTSGVAADPTVVERADRLHALAGESLREIATGFRLHDDDQDAVAALMAAAALRGQAEAFQRLAERGHSTTNLLVAADKLREQVGLVTELAEETPAGVAAAPELRRLERLVEQLEEDLAERRRDEERRPRY